MDHVFILLIGIYYIYINAVAIVVTWLKCVFDNYLDFLPIIEIFPFFYLSKLNKCYGALNLTRYFLALPFISC